MRLKPPNHSSFIIWAAGLVLLPALPLYSADAVTLYLRNGDRITGVIHSEDTNRVVLTTPWIKELTIPSAQISKRELVVVKPRETPPAPAVGAGATAGTTSPELKMKPARLLAAWSQTLVVPTISPKECAS